MTKGKQNLELVVKPLNVPTEPEFNFEEIKNQVSNIATIYKNIEYTEDTRQEAKADLATLRRFSRAMNDKRIEVKKEYNKPLDKFEEKIKEIDGLIQEPIQLIDAQVKEYEQKIIDEKLAEAREYFESKAKKEGVDGFLSYSLVEQPNFSNLSKSLNQIKKDIDETVERVKSDWAVIEGMKSDFEVDMKIKYTNTLDLQEAIATDQKLKEQEEKRKAYELERKEKEAKAEAEKREKQKAQDVDLFVKPEEEKAAAEATVKPITKDVEEVHTIAFKVHGTKKQLISLSNFMKAEGIEFEQIKGVK